MKTFITLSIVLKISETTLTELEHLLDLIENYQRKITLMHPSEGDYHDWEEELIPANAMYSMIDKLAYRNAFAKIEMDVNGKNVLLNLQTRNEDDQIVVDFEFDQEVLETSYGSIQEIDVFIQAFMVLFSKSIQYEYMYADHEADYLYTAQRIKELDYTPYSIMKFPSRNMIFAAWYPDKMTLRDDISKE